MTKYRKKPVVIEAYQTDKELDIKTLEGTMHASIGDYIITGVEGEQYPCKPDIFKKTYETVDTNDNNKVIVLHYDLYDVDLETVREMFNILSMHFPDKKIIFLPKCVGFEITNKEEVIEKLQSMIQDLSQE